VWASWHREHSGLRAATTMRCGRRPGLLLSGMTNYNGSLRGRWAAIGLSQSYLAQNSHVHLSSRLRAPVRAAACRLAVT
jgi:hypothetical protein